MFTDNKVESFSGTRKCKTSSHERKSGQATGEIVPQEIGRKSARNYGPNESELIWLRISDYIAIFDITIHLFAMALRETQNKFIKHSGFGRAVTMPKGDIEQHRHAEDGGDKTPRGCGGQKFRFENRSSDCRTEEQEAFYLNNDILILKWCLGNKKFLV